MNIETTPCETVGELVDFLKNIDRRKRVRVEISKLMFYGMQLSMRENLFEVVDGHNRVVLRALDREGWQPIQEKEDEINL